MTIAHIGAWKVVSWIVGALAAVVFAIDPSYKMLFVALLVASAPPTIQGFFSLRLQKRVLSLQEHNRDTLHEVKTQTDGIFSKMSEKADRAEEKSDQQAVELSAATTRADHAEGRQEGIEAAQERHDQGKG